MPEAHTFPSITGVLYSLLFEEYLGEPGDFAPQLVELLVLRFRLLFGSPLASGETRSDVVETERLSNLLDYFCI